MGKKTEYLIFPFEVKEISEKPGFGIVKGYASTFGNIDHGDDRVHKGAFLDSLSRYTAQNRPLKMKSEHDVLIGAWPIFKEDENGLYVEGEINLGVKEGHDAYLLAKQKVLTDLSIGYRATDFSYTEENGKYVRELKKVELYEVSLVPTPMNDKCSILDVKEFKTITDASKYLKSAGLSNKEANEIIFFLKSLLRNEILDEMARNESQKSIISKVDEIINQVKKGA